MDTLSNFALPGILLLLTLGFGFWVSRSGRPYNGLLFNVHKLAALAMVIVIGIKIVPVLKPVQPQPLVISLLAAAGLCAVALFVTGALMSIGRLPDRLTLAVHRAALILLPPAMAAALYLLGIEGQA